MNENTTAELPPAIELSGVSYAFKSRQALERVSLRVEQGSIHGFVGANGAGKTTTLKIVATLLRPRQGYAKLFGRPLNRHTTWAQRVTGYMPDDSGLYDNLRVIEYLDFFAAAYGIGRREREALIGGVLDLTDMGSRRHDMIQGLSRGMRQRVALARVLIHDPKLLLLDEPASGLDPRARIELMEILRELRSMGKTIFISSHILSELAELCDAVTLIDRGEIRFTGSMEGLLSRGQENRSFVVRFADAESDHENFLASIDDIEHFEHAGGAAEYRVQVDKHGLSSQDFLRKLVMSGADVTGFAVDQRGLDQAFLDLTKPGIEG